MPLTFAVTWDYRCPFARNAHDNVVEGLLDGAEWTVEFVPFSLAQVHVVDGEPDVWDEPAKDSGLLALQAGVAVRDMFPEAFLRTHRALFDARHLEGRDLRSAAVIESVLDSAGVDSAAVAAAIDSGGVLEVVAAEHSAAAQDHDVWGVPTFIASGQAAFVRLMSDSGRDPSAARATIERVIELSAGWPDLNELKHTSVER